MISPEGARIAQDGGLDVVMDRCLKIEHARIRGRMHWLGFDTGVIAGAPTTLGLAQPEGLREQEDVERADQRGDRTGDDGGRQRG